MVHLIGSTRPNSRSKFFKDESDILFLLRWLVTNHETFDFDGYAAKNVERLHTAVRDLVQHWQLSTKAAVAQTLLQVLKPRDRAVIFN
jgi:hypothetical protein